MRKPQRRWLAHELSRARVWREEQMPYAVIARHLGRTIKAVEGALAHYGLQRPRPRLADHEADLRRLHARGLPDPEVARLLGLGASTVAIWRGRLGLRANGVRPHLRRRGYRRACALAGVSSLAELRQIQAALARAVAERERQDREGPSCGEGTLRGPARGPRQPRTGRLALRG